MVARPQASGTSRGERWRAFVALEHDHARVGAQSVSWSWPRPTSTA